MVVMEVQLWYRYGTKYATQPTQYCSNKAIVSSRLTKQLKLFFVECFQQKVFRNVVFCMVESGDLNLGSPKNNAIHYR